MIKKLSIALCCCAIWMFSSNFVLAQGKAKVFIKKNINGKVEEESREINLEGGEDIDAILRELGIIDEIGQLKPGQEFEIKIDKISPEGGSENIKLFFAPDGGEPQNFGGAYFVPGPQQPPQAFLGVMLIDGNEDEETGEGVWISDVVEGSVAQEKGLMTGDRLLEIDNQSVTSSGDVIRIVKSKKPGEKIEIQYVRAGKTKKMKVELGQKEAEPNFEYPEYNGMQTAPWSFPSPPGEGEMKDYKFFFEGDSITIFCPDKPTCICPSDSMRICQPFRWEEDGMAMEEKAYLGVSPFWEASELGVAIQIETGTPAEKMGLLSGDVITAIDGMGIQEFDELAAKISAKKPGESVVLDILRNNRATKISGELGMRTISQLNDFRIFHDYRGQDEDGSYNYDFEFDMDQEDLKQHMEEMLRDLDMRQLELNGERQGLLEELERLSAPTESISISIRIAEITSDELQSVNANADTKLKAINDLEIEQISFFPNPNDGLLNLTFATVSSDPVKIHIYDTQGQMVYTEEINQFKGSYKNQIDISGQPNGTYFLQIVQGQKTYAKKIVKGN